MKNVWLWALLAAVLSGALAHATTISIDGNPIDWPVGSPTSLLATDSNEGDISDPVDLSAVYFTNNVTTMFWRVDTHGSPTRWTNLGSGYPQMSICMNVDNETGTGFAPTVCANQMGMDYRLLLTGTGASAVDVELRRCDDSSCNTVVAGAIVDAATQNDVTEVSARLSDLGVTSDRTIPSVVRFVNFVGAEPEDVIRDSGILSATIPGPTAVDLTFFTAQFKDTGVALHWATAAEYNILGFHLHRSATTDRAMAERVTNDLLPALGSGVSGAIYAWTDSSAQAGVAYSYWLEVVNVSGELEEYGPVTIAPNQAPVQPRVFLPLLER
jgi:hypothetical protein